MTSRTLAAASRKSPSEDAVDLAKFASCVAVIGSPMVGRAALELATSFDVGYKSESNVLKDKSLGHSCYQRIVSKLQVHT